MKKSLRPSKNKEAIRRNRFFRLDQKARIKAFRENGFYQNPETNE